MFILERLISLVAPHTCLGCGGEDSPLCARCARHFCPPSKATCYRCGRPASSHVCPACSRQSPFDKVWVRTNYAGLIKRLVHDFKFARAQDAARTIAQLMIQTLPRLPPETIITSVPTATSRRRARGYDHAALLGRAVAHRLGLPYVATLSRYGQARQVGASRKLRQSQLSGAIRAKHSRLLQGAPVLLVDDIITTGASVDASAKVLLSVGAKKVDVLVFAQKQ